MTTQPTREELSTTLQGILNQLESQFYPYIMHGKGLQLKEFLRTSISQAFEATRVEEKEIPEGVTIDQFNSDEEREAFNEALSEVKAGIIFKVI